MILDFKFYREQMQDKTLKWEKKCDLLTVGKWRISAGILPKIERLSFCLEAGILSSNGKLWI